MSRWRVILAVVLAGLLLLALELTFGFTNILRTVDTITESVNGHGSDRQ